MKLCMIVEALLCQQEENIQLVMPLSFMWLEGRKEEIAVPLLEPD